MTQPTARQMSGEAGPAFEIGRATITLRYLKRVGLVNFKKREWWLRQKVFIWSQEHNAFWRENASGYTMLSIDAGVYDFADAYERTEHCGPGKQIVYHAALPYAARTQPEKR